MHHYRQALLRMRQGESDRDIAAARLMGRRKAGDWRSLAKARGWLDPQVPLPDDQAVSDALAPPKRASSTVSSLEAHRAKVASWVEQGVSGTAIHQALVRQHGWSGSYSGVRRMVAAIRAALPPELTCRPEFAPGEAAQVDFGAGPMMAHPSGQMRRSWAFVMTLAHSRHQYLEFAWDQTVATWLGCHRRALEWFNGVPQRIVIDNAKCAITRACAQDPVVQRAYHAKNAGYVGALPTKSQAQQFKATGRLVTVCAADIEPEHVEWLVDQSFPLGMLAVIGGQPGLGKSQISINLAAGVTTGVGLPGNGVFMDLGSVIILANEDDAARTI